MPDFDPGQSFNFDLKINNPFFRSRVDIIIPYHGEYSSVRNLVESIMRETRSNPYLITLVDDASPNQGFLQEMMSLPQVTGVRLPEQQGFGAALKAGFDFSQKIEELDGKPVQLPPTYVCFLNSDCLIRNPNWLMEMGNCLLRLKDSGVKLVSARSNNPVSEIKAMKADREDKAQDMVANQALPLFCALCHRELFKRIGGFIKPYPFGGYEDEELFWRMKKHGYKQAICGTSWVYHEGERTISSLLGHRPEVQKIMTEENRERCISDIKSLG